jgi:hypothetical protein
MLKTVVCCMKIAKFRLFRREMSASSIDPERQVPIPIVNQESFDKKCGDTKEMKFRKHLQTVAKFVTFRACR